MDDRPVSDRLRAVLAAMLDDSSTEWTARRLAEISGVPLSTVSSVLARAIGYRWATSHLDRGTRLYTLEPAGLAEVNEVTAGQRDITPTQFRNRTLDELYGPPRTLTDLVATEPRELVERVCEHLGWPSPYPQKKDNAPGGT